MEGLLEELKNTECPLLWNVNSEDRRVGQKMISNLHESDGGAEPFQNFVYYITAVYSSAVFDKNIIAARNIFKEYETVYQKVIEAETMRDYELAFKHLYTSSKAFLIHDRRNDSEFFEIMREIPDLKKFDPMNTAAIYGVKAALFFEISPGYATDDGCDLAKKALKLDPNQGEWYFLYGKGLHRSRRYRKDGFLPSKEEMKSLEKSLELCQSASKMVFLAECYVDAVDALYRENYSIPKDHRKDIYHKLGKAATELYKDAANLKEYWYILLRCGMGFRKLRSPFMDYELSEKYLKKAYHLNPESGFVCHQLSMLLAKKKNHQEAFEFAKKACDRGIVLAAVEEIRMGLALNKNYNVSNSLDRNLDTFNDPDKIFLLLQKGSYYLFKRRDLEAGLQAYMQAFNISIDRIVPYLEDHRPCFNHSFQNKPFSVPEFVYHLLRNIKTRCISTVDIDITDKLEEVLKRKYSTLLKEKSTPVINELVSKALGDSI